MRISRVGICHEGTFWALVAAAYYGNEFCLAYRGRYWRRLESGRGFALYQRHPYDLYWLWDRVEQYEFYLYSHLLSGSFGPDGVLRDRVHLGRAPSGAYRPAPTPARDMAQFSGG